MITPGLGLLRVSECTGELAMVKCLRMEPSNPKYPISFAPFYREWSEK